MRLFLLIAFGLQLILGTTCMSQTASAQELPQETMMSQESSRSAFSHADCTQQDQRQERNMTPIGDSPCLGHCFSQATSRAVSAATVQASSCPSATVPASVSLVPALAAFTPVASTLFSSLSPPETGTVVLLQ